MSAGRTTWRAKPCGWRDRERVVALGEEFGPAGPLVLDTLEELAKEQRGDDGSLRAGLRALSRAAFLPRGTDGVDLARAILVFAASVGALDDLTISDDVDMTVTCRVSGFASDQGAGYEALRKANLRAAADAAASTGHGPSEGDTTVSCPDAGDTTLPCPDSRDVVPECPPTGQDRTEEGKGKEERASAPVTGLHPRFGEVIAILRAAPGLVVEDMAVNSAITGRVDSDPVANAHTVAGWAHDGDLVVKSAARLMRSAATNAANELARQDGIRDAAAKKEAARGTSRPSARPGRGGGRRQGFTEQDLIDAAEELKAG